MTKDEQIIKTLELINFIDFSFKENHPVICQHYQRLNWDATKTIHDIDEIKLHIWYAILNYLYTSDWGKYDKLTEKARKAFGIAVLKEKVKNTNIKTEGSQLSTKIDIEKEEEDLIRYLSSNWQEVFTAHGAYFNLLVRYNRLKKIKGIQKIIIFEAPPFPKNTKLNYLLTESRDPSGPYFTSIKKAFKEEKTIIKKLILNNVLFFDLLMLPIPLSSSIRRDWSTKDQFKVNGKQLSVVLFEMNLEHYLKAFGPNHEIISNIKIAIGTPHLTSLGLYNHFCNTRNSILGNNKYDDIKTSLTICNSIEDKKKLKNYVVPLFKSCFVNASNNPDGELLKHALGLNEKKKP